MHVDLDCSRVLYHRHYSTWLEHHASSKLQAQESLQGHILGNNRTALTFYAWRRRSLDGANRKYRKFVERYAGAIKKAVCWHIGVDGLRKAKAVQAVQPRD